MTKDSYQTLKINREMKENFIEVCRRVGIKYSKAFVRFMTYCIEKNEIDLDLKKYEDISKNKLDTVIIFRIDKERKLKFKELCERSGISVSCAIKLFIDDVINAKNMKKYFS